MSNKRIHFKLITHEKIVYENDIDEFYAQGIDGDFGILPDHTPFMSALKIGVIKIINNKNTDYFAILGGVLQFSDNHAVVLSEDAENGKDVNIAIANAEKEKLEARVGSDKYKKDIERSEKALAMTLAKIKAATNNSLN